MARGLWLMLAAALAVAPAAWASEACDEGREVTGVAVGIRDGSVAVAALSPASAAVRAGFLAGDLVLQVNDVVPGNCAQWARAVRKARDDGKALLVLVRRGGADVPLVLGASTWSVPALARETPPGPASPPGGGRAPRPAASPSPAAEPPRSAAVPPPAPPLPPETAVSVEGVVGALAALAPLDHPPSDLLTYREATLRVRREIETLAARGSAPDDVVTDLRSVMRYYDGAALAWEAIEGKRVDERRIRRLPQAENQTEPFFSDSPAAALLDEFSFLDGTVARQPRGGRLAETSGLWRPVWARLLLWERGAQALDDLRARRGL